MEHLKANIQATGFSTLGLSELRPGSLTGFDADGWTMVDQTLPCKALVPLRQSQIGAEVIVTSLVANTNTLLILGVVQPAMSDITKTVIKADIELILKCGKSSLSLARDGKIKIRGKQLLSRADGQNRVQGANVSLN